MTEIAIQAMRGLALDQLAAWQAVLDLVGGRPTSEEELAALRDSESSDYHAGVQCAAPITKTEMARQPYQDCHIAAGHIEGADNPKDTVYLELKHDAPDKCLELHLRPDEAQAIVWVLSGAIWPMLVHAKLEPCEADS